MTMIPTNFPNTFWFIPSLTALPPSGWLEDLLGLDFFHRAVRVYVECGHIDEVTPYLKGLPDLRKVSIGTKDDEDWACP